MTIVRPFCASRASTSACLRQDVQRVGVDDCGHLRRLKKSDAEAGGVVTLAQSGTDGQHGDALDQRGQVLGREVLGRGLAGIVGFQRPGHQFRRVAGDDRERGCGHRRRDQAGPDAQRGQRRHRWRTGFAARDPNEPPTTSTWPNLPLLESAARGA